MLKYITLKIEGYGEIKPPGPIPQGDKAPDILSNAITILITAGIIAAIITIIWAGIQWTTSGGDKQKVAAAKGRLTWGIIGLVVVLLSYLVIGLLSHLFGVNLLNFRLS